MHKFNKYRNLLHFAIAIVFGILLENNLFAKIYIHAVFVIAIIRIIIKKNNNGQVLFWSFHLVTLEVLMRMTSGLIFYEFVKYAIIILMIIGYIVEKKPKRIPIIYIIYLFLLLMGITFISTVDYDNISKEIAFNLSGPFLLGISAIYFYNRTIKLSLLTHCIKFALYPIISLNVYLYIKTPNFKDIIFVSGANFDTSGGFGPNQVSTILGFGIFAFFILNLLKKRISGWFIIDIVLLIYTTYRCLLTFSRGGLITGFVAVLLFSIYYILSQRRVIYNSLKYLTLTIVIGFSIWIYASDVTGGMLNNRYAGKNTSGIQKEDITSGRKGYFALELQAFYENPIFGIGVGGSKFYREKHSQKFIGASHNELSRLLSEHGSIGLLLIIILIIHPLIHLRRKRKLEIAFLLSFYSIWLLTINHSSMRLAFPGFIFGLSLINISLNEKNSLHRK